MLSMTVIGGVPSVGKAEVHTCEEADNVHLRLREATRSYKLRS